MTDVNNNNNQTVNANNNVRVQQPTINNKEQKRTATKVKPKAIDVKKLPKQAISQIDALLSKSEQLKPKKQPSRADYIIDSGLLEVINNACEKFGITAKVVVDIIVENGIEINGQHIYPKIIDRDIYEARKVLKKRAEAENESLESPES
ncbi:hypothetical protein JMC51_004340 [Vibrio parahaemolyticus]|uniref:hypothetical protein n=1 Tax=Vibrio parahaemolyticus TaxID=670 RepID=UPI001C92ED8B|nr:hypothetical protein [Vibrio parahaemolyticus]EHA6961840.1 hypothetical protein [Vibrio parahaemolyticus]EHA6976220.1 hypothetical protein [Vibrio parahaemolyticus]MBY4651939.1 hypothetical protein [Vibrio parahaemolyticus]